MFHQGFCLFQGLEYGVPVNIQYPLSGTRHRQLVRMGPKWPKKVRLTLPKGPGPLLKDDILDCFWAHVGLHRGPKTQGKPDSNGPKWQKRDQTGQNRAQVALKGPFDPPRGSSTTFEKGHFNRFWARNRPKPYPCAPLLNLSFSTGFGPIWAPGLPVTLP